MIEQATLDLVMGLIVVGSGRHVHRLLKSLDTSNKLLGLVPLILLMLLRRSWFQQQHYLVSLPAA